MSNTRRLIMALLTLAFILIVCIPLLQRAIRSSNLIYKNMNKSLEEESRIFNDPGNDANVDYLKGIDIIYWINLDRSKDRYKHMVNLFNNDEFNNIQIERVSAHDGKFPNPIYNKLNLTYKQKNDFEYACLTSHLETVRKFSNTSYETALIMEDDITLEFRPYWRKTVQQIMDEAPEDWEIIQLCYISVHNDPMYFSIYEENSDFKCVSAAAYLMKNKAAKRIMESIYKNGKYNMSPLYNHHADCFLFSNCKTYTYKYPYFIYKTDNTSLLHPEDLGEHEQSKLRIINMYNALV